MTGQVPVRPAWARDTSAVRLDGVPSLGELSPEWAWGGSTGRGVRVALIDSGVEHDHPLLGEAVASERGAMVVLDRSGQPALVSGAHGDAYGHGTACASVVHAIAPEATIVSVRVLGERNSGRAAQFLGGLAWAIEQGFEVINLSLGTTNREWAQPFHELCDAAYFAGSLVVTAANNIFRESFPSMYASVVSVACNNASDRFRFQYNPDCPPEFLAPGIDLQLAWRGGGTMTVTGNSFAAPHLAGIAALIRAKHPQLRPIHLKTVLWATATNVTAASGRVQPPELPGRLSRAAAASTSIRRSVALSTAAGLPRGEGSPMGNRVW